MEVAKVFFSVDELKVMSAMHLLKEAGIMAGTIDKRDSAHSGAFGKIEIYIQASEETQAREILRKAEIL
jgi:hypothetical protein